LENFLEALMSLSEVGREHSQEAPTPVKRPVASTVVRLYVGPYQANTAIPQQAATSVVLPGFAYRSAAVPFFEKFKGEDAMATQDELTQARIAASEAKTDTKIARFESVINTLALTLGGKIDALSTQVGEHRKDRNLIIGTIVVAAIALGALFVAMATYGDALFGRGLNVRDVIHTTVKDTLEQQGREQPRSNTQQ
jgi:hypothetical protein